MLSYEDTAHTMIERIYSLIPEHPEILQLDSPWDLFQIDGFGCDDLQPTLAQAAVALSIAKAKYKANNP